jgi:hypothetical protein
MRAALAARVYARLGRCPRRCEMTPRPRDAALLLAFFLSGAAALGYELLWTRLLGFALGSETVGVLATLAGFFGGMALGAVVPPPPRRGPPATPCACSSSLELVAAGFARRLAVPAAHALARELPPLLGPLARRRRLLGRARRQPARRHPRPAARHRSASARPWPPSPPPAAAPTAASPTAAASAASTPPTPPARPQACCSPSTWVLPRLGYALGALVPAALGVAAAALARRWAAGRDLAPVPADMSPRPADPVPADMSPGSPTPVPADMSLGAPAPVPADMPLGAPTSVPADMSPRPTVDTSAATPTASCCASRGCCTS